MNQSGQRNSIGRENSPKTVPLEESVIDAVLRHPATAAAITLLLLVTGGLGSVYSNEIGRAFPLHWGPYDGVSVPAIVVWSMTAVSGMLFFFRQRATDHARERAQNEVRDVASSLTSAQEALVHQNQRMETLLRTMPPENFLEQFVELYATAHNALSTALDSRVADRIEAVKLGIRHHLRVVAYLAKKFDGDRPNARYAANVMIFHKAADLRPEQIDEFGKLLKFCDQSTDCRKLFGLLELVPDFSSTDTDELLPDDKIRRLVLPIPVQHENHRDRWLVLPGAPLAFVTRKASAFADTSKLREWLDKEGDFQDVVKNELERYFAENPNLQSFVSIPLLTAECLYSGGKEALPRPVGVLNIHVDSPGLLRGANWAEPRGSPMSHFNAIIQPFALNLVKLLTNGSDRVEGQADSQVER